jgi:hypothetical protein
MQERDGTEMANSADTNTDLKIRELENLLRGGAALSPAQQQDLADAYRERAESALLVGNARSENITDLDAAARGYLDLWSRIDETWPAAGKNLTKDQWSDELQGNLATAYVMRGFWKSTAAVKDQAVAHEAGRRDIDLAIPILQRLESENLVSDLNPWNAHLLAKSGFMLLLAYAFRFDLHQDTAAKLRDSDEFLRRWDPKFGVESIERLFETPILPMLFRTVLKRRIWLKKNNDQAGAHADVERLIDLLEQWKRVRPQDTDVAEDLKKARSAATMWKWSGGKLFSSISKSFKSG